MIVKSSSIIIECRHEKRIIPVVAFESRYDSLATTFSRHSPNGNLGFPIWHLSLWILTFDLLAKDKDDMMHS